MKAKLIACAVGIGLVALWGSSLLDRDVAPLPAQPTETAASELERSNSPVEIAQPSAEGREEVTSVVSPAAASEALPDLRGRVVDEANAPIEGALVTIVDLPHIGARMTSTGVSTTSDADGWFRFDAEHGSPGYVMAHVEQLGYVSDSTELVGQVNPVVVLRRAGILRGRVLDWETQSPIENVRLSFGDYDWRDGAMRPTVTDAAGRFVFDRAPRSGEWTVEVQAPGHVPVERNVPEIDESGAGDFEIFLSRGRSLAGVVRDHESGAPIAEALVAIGLDDVCTTDSEGGFEVHGLGDEQVTLEAKKEGYGVTHLKVDPASIGHGGTLELPLLAECVIEGTIFEGDGTPVESALVILTIDRAIDRAAVAQKILDATGRAVPNGVGFAELGNLHSCRTDAEGRYRIGRLSPHVDYPSLHVTSIGDGRSLSGGPVRFDHAGTTKTVDLAFAGDTGTIQGQVTVNGKPAYSSVDWQSGAAQGLEFTDDEGRYRLTDVVPGEVVLEVYVDGFGVKHTESITLAPNQELEWDIALELDTPLVSGRVVTQSGVAVTDELIFVRNESGSVRTQGEIGKDGTFQLAVSAKEGTPLRLFLRYGPRMAATNVRAGDSSIDFVVHDLAPLHLDVRSEDDGPPLQDLDFEWRYGDDEDFRALHSSFAEFSVGTGWILELPVGVVDVRVLTQLGDHAPATIERVELELGRSAGAIPVMLSKNR